MPSCAFPTCTNHSKRKNKTYGITFHSFPQHETQNEKWRCIIARDREDEFYKPNASSVICSDHFFEEDMYLTKRGFRRIKKTAIPNVQITPGTSGTGVPRRPTQKDDDSKWPYSDSDTDEDDDKNASGDEESNPNENYIEHHEIIEDVTEVKMEPPDEVDLDDVKVEPEEYDTILGSDGGAGAGFSPFVRATVLNLPIINMFAIFQFITKNQYYNTLDYDKLKTMIQTNNTKLLSGLRVQSREGVHRVSSTVHLQAISQCGIEYDTNTHTVTRSECMCSHATCEHVAALLMWLHCVTNQKRYNPKFIPDAVKVSPDPIKLKPEPIKQVSTKAKVITWEGKVIKRDSGVVDSTEVSLTCPADPLDVSEDVPGPSTAKRKKLVESTPAPSPGTSTYTKQVFKTKSTSKDTDTITDESVIKCSFTRKCFFNVWRSTNGDYNEKLRHTRSIMSKAFQDDNYIIDFLPLEKKLEELCMEIQGYWNNEENKEDFESKYAEWFAIVENIDMKKTKRDVVVGASTSFSTG